MTYPDITPGIFLARPNRFIAQVEADGGIHRAHVKNTGRCRELLLPGVVVYLQRHHDAKRSTAYSLIAVEKGRLLINMDSQAPNKVMEEALRGGLPLPGLDGPADTVTREVTVGGSRLDFLAERHGRRLYIEVKGVTLEKNGVARFPDAPTERGVKHLKELVLLKRQGFEACAAFLIQMEGMRWFTPNDDTHPAFGEALREAAREGVAVRAWGCRMTPESIVLGEPVEIRL